MLFNVGGACQWQRDVHSGTEPLSNPGGSPAALKPERIAVLHDIVTQRAQASLQEIADELYHRCGSRVWVLSR